jgi:hypothetical protein
MKFDGQLMSMYSWPATMFKTAAVENFTTWSTVAGCQNCSAAITTSSFIDLWAANASVTGGSTSMALPGNATTGKHLTFASDPLGEGITNFRWSSLLANSTISVKSSYANVNLNSVTSGGEFITTTNTKPHADVLDGSASSAVSVSVSQSLSTNFSRLFSPVITTTYPVDLSTVGKLSTHVPFLNSSTNRNNNMTSNTNMTPNTNMTSVSQSSLYMTSEASVLGSSATYNNTFPADTSSATTALPITFSPMTPSSMTSSISSSSTTDGASSKQQQTTIAAGNPLLIGP